MEVVGRGEGGGTDIIKSKRLVANAQRSGSRETLLIFRGLDNGRACPGLSLPRRLAWPRCHREWRNRQMEGRRDAGRGGGEQMHCSGGGEWSIVKGTDSLCRRARGRKGQRKVKTGNWQ